MLLLVSQRKFNVPFPGSWVVPEIVVLWKISDYVFLAPVNAIRQKNFPRLESNVPSCQSGLVDGVVVDCAYGGRKTKIYNVTF